MLSVIARSKKLPRQPAHPRTRKGKDVAAIMDGYQCTAETPYRRRPSVAGIRSRLGIMSFVANLFETNELLPKSKRHTDASLLRIILDEFPDRPSRRKVRISPVANYRYKFNTGELTGEIPTKISFRYNSLGQVVDYRTGNHVLSIPEQQALIEKFRKKARFYAERRAARLEDKRRRAAERARKFLKSNGAIQPPENPP